MFCPGLENIPWIYIVHCRTMRMVVVSHWPQIMQFCFLSTKIYSRKRIAVMSTLYKNYKMHPFKLNLPKAFWSGSNSEPSIIGRKFRYFVSNRPLFTQLCSSEDSVLRIPAPFRLSSNCHFVDTRQHPANSSIISYCRDHVTHESTLFGSTAMSSPMSSPMSAAESWIEWKYFRMGARALVLGTANKTSWCLPWHEGICFHFRRHYDINQNCLRKKSDRGPPLPPPPVPRQPSHNPGYGHSNAAYSVGRHDNTR